MLACELGLAGIRPVVLDPMPGPNRHPRANGIVGQGVWILDHRGLYSMLAGPGHPPPLAMGISHRCGDSLRRAAPDGPPVSPTFSSWTRLVPYPLHARAPHGHRPGPTLVPAQRAAHRPETSLSRLVYLPG
jgi:2-polyprenyl-6-methoxyphenol hydroxylase-like FAD-dependent oxidoreductase